MPAKQTKCARSVCQRRSADPKAAGWLWIEIEPGPPTTGWYCRACADELQRLLADQGVQPQTEPLH
jgi:hypothetical protein